MCAIPVPCVHLDHGEQLIPYVGENYPLGYRGVGGNININKGNQTPVCQGLTHPRGEIHITHIVYSQLGLRAQEFGV